MTVFCSQVRISTLRTYRNQGARKCSIYSCTNKTYVPTHDSLRSPRHVTAKPLINIYSLCQQFLRAQFNLLWLDVDGNFNLRGHIVLDDSVISNTMIVPDNSATAFAIKDESANSFITFNSVSSEMEIEQPMYMTNGVIYPADASASGLSIQGRASSVEFVKVRPASSNFPPEKRLAP
eukprot:2424024-Pyramimonas_sp.AAC.1